MSRGHRQKVVVTALMALLIIFAGCAEDSSTQNTQTPLQDSDGDGVIDSKDYAPNDPSVQEREDVVQQPDVGESDRGAVDAGDSEIGDPDDESKFGMTEDYSVPDDFSTPTPLPDDVYPDSDDYDYLSTRTSTPEEVDPEDYIPTQTSTPGEINLDDIETEPDPVVLDVRHPEPQGVSTDDEWAGDYQREYTVTIENSGTAGDIGVTLVMLEDEGDDPDSLSSYQVASKERYFSANERREVSFTAGEYPEYEAYAFQLWAAEIEGDIRNDGESGNVNVEIQNPDAFGDTEELSGVTIDEKSVYMTSDETRTVRFEIESNSLFYEDIEMAASPAE
jgi:hypothetical protein